MEKQKPKIHLVSKARAPRLVRKEESQEEEEKRKKEEEKKKSKDQGMLS